MNKYMKQISEFGNNFGILTLAGPKAKACPRPLIGPSLEEAGCGVEGQASSDSRFQALRFQNLGTMWDGEERSGKHHSQLGGFGENPGCKKD